MTRYLVCNHPTLIFAFKLKKKDNRGKRNRKYDGSTKGKGRLKVRRKSKENGSKKEKGGWKLG